MTFVLKRKKEQKEHYKKVLEGIFTNEVHVRVFNIWLKADVLQRIKENVLKQRIEEHDFRGIFDPNIRKIFNREIR